ncbi:DUF4838 domain-containing protein [Pedobacter agri]|uniref:DUF4838 domain-containing protein n=1 Tax=Pedobacter agri TaxID=454586 RepID=A0A9X3IA15_9SPHI|nr:DUF4838 domain-containing protein [Pedobacter agri]MCX3265574.1 DUF4838 domain-containing protein [Pedobacter agri]
MMGFSGWKICLTIIAFAMLNQSYAQINLVENAKSNYQIIVSKRATNLERKAADVLKSYIDKISKADLPIVQDHLKAKEFEIVIGNTNRNHSDEQFDNDGFLIKTAANKIFIYGQNEQATLYGVYHFLDHYLGCKMYTADHEFIPQQTNIKLSAINDLQQPQFKFRQVYYPDQYNEEYRNWHKLQLLEDEWGLWGHTFDKLVPAKLYFHDHPEYYALVNGDRKTSQLCLSNPDVYRITVENLKKEITAHPEKKYWSVSQNDGFGFCTCDACSATDQKFGGPQGSLISFVNKVAKNFPDQTISTLAYLYSKRPPEGIKPLKNVSIMLSTIDLDRSKPVENNTKANGFKNDLKGWSAVCDNVMIWDYVVQFTNYVSPFPNLNTLQENMKFFATNHVKGVFIQGSEASTGEFTALKSYLLAKLSWNPILDIEAEKKNFMASYYGKAAPNILTYAAALEKNLISSNRILDIYGDPSAEWKTWLTPEQIDHYSSILDQAEQAVRNDPVILNRILIERLPLEYAVLQQARFYGLEKHGVFTANGKNWKVRPGFEQKVSRFIASAKQLGIKQLSEDGFTIDDYQFEWTKIFNDGPLLHLATNKNVEALTPFNTDFLAKGTKTLTDGSRGYQNFQYNYLGWLGNDMEVVIDLGSIQNTNQVIVGFLEDQRHWAFLPNKVMISVSTDHKVYQPMSELIQPSPIENYDKQTHRLTLDFKKSTKARYIKVKATNQSKLPEWRDYPNKKPWLFCDEIEVN